MFKSIPILRSRQAGLRANEASFGRRRRILDALASVSSVLNSGEEMYGQRTETMSITRLDAYGAEVREHVRGILFRKASCILVVRPSALA